VDEWCSGFIQHSIAEVAIDLNMDGLLTMRTLGLYREFQVFTS
jgi:hypothetical protein